MASGLKKIGLVAAFLFSQIVPCRAYSVLTHEAIIDAAWEPSIRPLLLKKYPGATNEQLREAHGFAYGGAMMPDMGYFPYGSKFFTNLVHYVRSGDFVTALLADSHSLTEYAFALGALSHYNADKYGHALGTNRAVPIVYPASRRFGNVVTYEEDPLAHKRVEFGFDVLQTARGNYAPQAYHDFIGFHFADSLLKRVFVKIYGLPLDDLFGNFNKSVNTLRWSVKSLFPFITRTAWVRKKSDIQKVQPGVTERKFRYRMKHKAYNQEFNRNKDKPNFFTKLLSGLIWVLPKIGPLKPLKFKVPGPEAEKIYIQSFDTVTLHYGMQLKELNSSIMGLDNFDYDTGKKTEAGEYRLADQTYRCLLMNLKKEGFTQTGQSLKQNILDFFSNHKVIEESKKKKYAKKAEEALAALKSVPVNQK